MSVHPFPQIRYGCIGHRGAEQGFNGQLHDILGEDHQQEVPCREDSKEADQHERHSIEKVAHNRASDCTHPQMPALCPSFDLVHEPSVRQLAKQESGKGADDYSWNVGEYGVIGRCRRIQIIRRREPNADLRADDNEDVAEKGEDDGLSCRAVAPDFRENVTEHVCQRESDRAGVEIEKAEEAYDLDGHQVRDDVAHDEENRDDEIWRHRASSVFERVFRYLVHIALFDAAKVDKLQLPCKFYGKHFRKCLIFRIFTRPMPIIMKNDLKWIVVRIDGKIAAISTDYRQLASISSQLAKHHRLHENITASAATFEEVWKLRQESRWEDLMLIGTEFQKRVWRQLWELTHQEKGDCPAPGKNEGSTSARLVSYTDFATLCQNRSGVRAVAHAIGLNPVAVVIPCHLVVPKESIDRISAIRKKAESTIFKGDDICLNSILNDHATDFGEYGLGRDMKRGLILLELGNRPAFGNDTLL